MDQFEQNENRWHTHAYIDELNAEVARLTTELEQARKAIEALMASIKALTEGVPPHDVGEIVLAGGIRNLLNVIDARESDADGYAKAAARAQNELNTAREEKERFCASITAALQEYG